MASLIDLTTSTAFGTSLTDGAPSPIENATSKRPRDDLDECGEIAVIEISDSEDEAHVPKRPRRAAARATSYREATDSEIDGAQYEGQTYFSDDVTDESESEGEEEDEEEDETPDESDIEFTTPHPRDDVPDEPTDGEADYVPASGDGESESEGEGVESEWEDWEDGEIIGAW